MYLGVSYLTTAARLLSSCPSDTYLTRAHLLYLVPPTSAPLSLQCPRSGRLGRLSGILFHWEGLCEHVARGRTVSAQPGTQERGLGFSPLTPLLQYYRPRKSGDSPNTWNTNRRNASGTAFTWGSTRALRYASFDRPRRTSSRRSRRWRR